jgi:hypothetical protein
MSSVPVVIESMQPDRRFVPEYLRKRLPAAVAGRASGGGTKHRRGSITDGQQDLCNLLVTRYGGHSIDVWSDGSMHLVRPGKPAKAGSSASVIVGNEGDALLTVFSDRWPGLPKGSYTLGVDGELHHPGDPLAHFTINVTPTPPRIEVRTPMTLAELLGHEEDDAYDWLIPNLLERGDRMVLTGKEGEGKSTLLRQIGLAAAAGLHPFSLEPIAPLRVLDVDCENSERQLRREFTRALQPFEGRSDMLDRFFIEVHTEGLILDQVRDPDGDRAWLEAIIVACQPQLVLLGPIYKVLIGVANDEEPNRELVKFLDRLRGRYGFAVLLEMHTPHDAKRPYGWSGWKRWPEFGLHLDEGGKLERWRGDREARAWPEQLIRGAPGGWLWTPGIPIAEAPSADPQEKRIVDAKLEVLRAMRRAKKPLAKQELLDRVSRQRAIVIVAFNRLRDQGAFLVTVENRLRSNGEPYPTELFVIDPDGPFGADQ